MQSQTLENWTIRRGTRVTVAGVPGVWKYVLPAKIKKRAVIPLYPVRLRAHVVAVWLEPHDLSAIAYAANKPYGMIESETEAVTICDAKPIHEEINQ